MSKYYAALCALSHLIDPQSPIQSGSLSSSYQLVVEIPATALMLQVLTAIWDYRQAILWGNRGQPVLAQAYIWCPLRACFPCFFHPQSFCPMIQILTLLKNTIPL